MNGYWSKMQSRRRAMFHDQPDDHEDRHVDEEPPGPDEPRDALAQPAERVGVVGRCRDQRTTDLARLVEAAPARRRSRPSVPPEMCIALRSCSRQSSGSRWSSTSSTVTAPSRWSALVDDRRRDQVVGREVVGDRRQRYVERAAARCRCRRRRRPASTAARAAAAGCARCRGTGRSASPAAAGRRRPARPGPGRAPACGPGPAPRRRWRRAAGSPARSSSCRRRCRRSTRAAGAAAPPRRAPSARAASAPPGAAARRAGRPRRRAASPRGRRRRAPPRACRGSRPGRPRAAPRARRRASRRRGPTATSMRRFGDSSCRTVARSAALSFSNVASRFAAPWPSSTSESPVTSSQSTVRASPRRRSPLPGRRTNSRVDRPVAGALLLHRDVLDGDRAVLAAGHLAVEQLAEDERLGRSLLEAAHVHQAGRDDLAGVDRGDPGHRQEDAAAAGHLDDQSEHPGRLAADAQGHDDVAHPADLVADRVEHGDPGQARDEDPCRRAAHKRSGYLRRRARRPTMNGNAPRVVAGLGGGSAA